MSGFKSDMKELIDDINSQMHNIILVYKTFLAILFLIITSYVVYLCVYSDWVNEVLIARALPLSILLVATSIMFFSIGHKTKD
ncbi:MAG: hypothetical protein Q4Q07_08345 [Tissierellia bacterium]|nr:hypothetical protein [Tissierellia bacterium]